VDEIEIQRLDDLEMTHFWYKSRKMQLTKFLSSLASSNLKVLDLGSATGGNTIHMANLGHFVTSVEFSDTGVEIQKKKGMQVVQADARCLPFPSNSFDVVVCLDVLEHIKEDGVALSEIRRVLVENGTFLLSVPEDPRLWSAHDVAVNHYRRYSKISLISLIELTGLHSEQVWSTLFLLRPFIILIRKFSCGSNLQKINVILNQIFYCICSFELLLPKHRGQGVTLWATGRKVPENLTEG